MVVIPEEKIILINIEIFWEISVFLSLVQKIRLCECPRMKDYNLKNESKETTFDQIC